MKFNFSRFLTLMLLGLVMGSAFAQEQRSKQKTPATEGAATAQSQALVNINTASLEQLTSLPRVGPAIAQRIIDFREEHGGFKAPVELMNVKGIGPKTYEKLSALIRVK